MPHPTLFNDAETYDVGLRLTITDHTQELEDRLTVGIEVRRLDADWQTLYIAQFTGRGRDFLSSNVEDVVHAWHYEDRRAIVREIQRNERQARAHHRRSMRQGG